MPWDAHELQAVCHAMLKHASKLGAQVQWLELKLVDDRTISRINSSHLGSSGPTNIISFPGEPPMPGILILSLDTLRRECLLYGQGPDEHLTRLLAHGMGHVAGFEHGEEMDAFCFSLEKAALKIAGIINKKAF